MGLNSLAADEKSLEQLVVDESALGEVMDRVARAAIKQPIKTVTNHGLSPAELMTRIEDSDIPRCLNAGADPASRALVGAVSDFY